MISIQTPVFPEYVTENTFSVNYSPKGEFFILNAKKALPVLESFPTINQRATKAMRLKYIMLNKRDWNLHIYPKFYMKPNHEVNFNTTIIPLPSFSFIVQIKFSKTEFRQDVKLKNLYAGWNNMDIELVRTNREKKEIAERMVDSNKVYVEILNKDLKSSTNFNLMKRRILRSDYDQKVIASIFRPPGDRLILNKQSK